MLRQLLTKETFLSAIWLHLNDVWHQVSVWVFIIKLTRKTQPRPFAFPIYLQLEQVGENFYIGHPGLRRLQHIFEPVNGTSCSYADVADKWLTLAMGEFVAESVGLRVIKNQPVSGAPGNLLLFEPSVPATVPTKTAELPLHAIQ